MQIPLVVRDRHFDEFFIRSKTLKNVDTDIFLHGDHALFDCQISDLIGTLAGDNTVFIVVGEGTEHQVMTKLKMMLG